MCVMESLDGKSKTMQYKIAEDINNKDIDSQTNVYDMLQSYAAAMASVGDGKPKPVMNVARLGKQAKQKLQKQLEQEESDSSSTDGDSGAEFQGHCNHCHEWGHKWADCPQRRRKSKKKFYKNKDKAEGKNKEAAAESTGKGKEAPAGYTEKELSAMLASISSPNSYKCGTAIATPRV